MDIETREEKPLTSQEEVVLARQAVRQWAQRVRFGIVDQTKIVTAASELGRNALVHGGGGHVVLEVVDNGSRRGLRLSFIDGGPGIADVDAALRDGFTTGSGMGLGLGGSRRLMDEFEIESTPGIGTRVTVVKWL
jgi:serine/threonine-protein kinase RsbT